MCCGQLQALEAIAKPYPALFCVCLVSEILTSAWQSAKNRVLGTAAEQPSLAVLASDLSVAAAQGAAEGAQLQNKVCLFKASAAAERCFATSTAVVRACHAQTLSTQASDPSTASTSTTQDSTAQALIKQASLLAFISPHAHQHTRQLSAQCFTAAAAAGPADAAIKQALLAGQSPFALFAAQPSRDGWLKLLQALQAQGDEGLSLDDGPHSILLTRRASAGSIARQQAVMYRATIQSQPPAAC